MCDIERLIVSLGKHCIGCQRKKTEPNQAWNRFLRESSSESLASQSSQNTTEIHSDVDSDGDIGGDIGSDVDGDVDGDVDSDVSNLALAIRSLTNESFGYSD